MYINGTKTTINGTGAITQGKVATIPDHRREPQAVWQELIHAGFAKRIIAATGLSKSQVYRWGETGAGRGVDPLTRMGQLLEATAGNDALIEWLCERRGGTFVRQPPPQPAAADWSAAVGQTQLALTELLGVCATLLVRRVRTSAEVGRLRQLWVRCASVMEGFVQACERGVFHCQAYWYPLAWWLMTGSQPEFAWAEV